MPRINDEDDVNLDDIDTEPQGPEDGDEAPEDGELDEENPDDEPEDGGGSEQPDIAARRERQQEGDEPPPRRRGDARIQRLTDQNRELTARLDTLLANLGTRQPAPAQQQGETETQRRERRALMSETERLSEDVRDSELRNQHQMRGLQTTIQDTTDRTLYETKAAVDPLYKKWSARVEEELTKLRSQGQGAPREAILFYLVGKAALDGRNGKTNRQRQQQARARVQSNTSRPGNSRSDTQAPSRRGGGKTLEDRLSDVPL